MGSTPGKYQSPFQALAMKNVDRASASPAQATVPSPTPMPFTPPSGLPAPRPMPFTPPDSGVSQLPITPAPSPVDNSGGYQNILKRLFAPGNRGAY